MFIEENMRVCAVVNNGSTYSGTVYKIQVCKKGKLICRLLKMKSIKMRMNILP